MSEEASVGYSVIEGVAVVTLSNPPVNALAPGMREGLIDSIDRANEDVTIKGILITGAGRNFIAGADIRQFGKERKVSSSLSTAALDASRKPVVAVIRGYALGAGLEHALACHYRFATSNAKLGLPEVKIGVIPAGGGTQRLTRLVGPKAAIELIISGRHISAGNAFELGLIDRIVPDDLALAEAIDFVKRLPEGQGIRRVRDMDARIESAKAHPEEWTTARDEAAANARFVRAPHAALACIEMAVSGTFEDGLALEQSLFAELESSEEAKALRYAFFAEREAAKIPGKPEHYKGEAVRSAAVIGAGTMGGGIAICFADARIPVKVLEASQDALDRGMQKIRDTYAVKVRRGRLSQREMDESLAYIQPVVDYEQIGDADVVIEAVFERIDLKKEVFERIDSVMKEGALLLTNSSAIDIDTMANATRRPADVAGAHFFAPANVMKLCEVVRGTHSSVDTILRTAKLGRDLKKISVVAGSCDGFAANRSRAPLVTEAMLLLEEGARPDQIDRVMKAFGYPMGPFEVSDLSGLDVSYDTRKRRAAADPSYRKLHVPDRMVELGRNGQKNGAGWYRYNPGDRKPLVDPAVDAIIAEVARALGAEQREFSDDEILQRLLFASVNEVCKILEDGKAYRASDVDVMWLYGFGFPRHRGGLMYWADTIGASKIAGQIEAWHEQFGKRWKPGRLLLKAAAEGLPLRELRAPGV
ncbi:3-hydroxyacyl-CoA dehydrogenase NAD-binding domain-containing protein [Paraburkholderia phenoliruptrix]|uniref:3-hydroxyacyl-CoA dehydrogenase NAD-binding domain-containing protein n=1 Tax=Paraburkholderia phenoliruptrix TaxID=252970 RepID=UPI001C6E284E|nr:3-hydroxyacyl-CoA dehydrogenase NAD-binding domain-containing protein [Paraburkholderia phenoliruptrix]MBW9105026.1 enoyl-CoA hydratase/isomerase family protein [Paraburkholderia phenoliruptrix]MBW9129672.1 enoyl-CoA hydratase/isomerase family protein [Paraburkholderia ginsengiterrae]